MSNLKIDLKSKLIIDKALEEKVKTFTDALNALPHELKIGISVGVGKEPNGEKDLDFDLSGLLIDQVRNHFKSATLGCPNGYTRYAGSKELLLNKEDTKNFLKAIEYNHDIAMENALEELEKQKWIIEDKIEALNTIF